MIVALDEVWAEPDFANGALLCGSGAPFRAWGDTGPASMRCREHLRRLRRTRCFSLQAYAGGVTG